MKTPHGDAPFACARHPGRPALTVCIQCERPMCGADLIESPAGFQCVDCAGPNTAALPLGETAQRAYATGALVALIGIVAALNAIGGLDVETFGLVPASVGLGEWWRLIMSAFLHGGLVHLTFNALLLWRLGSLIEQVIGSGPLVGLAASGMAGGGLGVVTLAWLAVATPIRSVPAFGWFLGAGPFSITVGASGAVFGLMGAIVIMFLRRGIDPWATTEGSTIGSLLLVNLVLTFAVPSISVGGHVGGLFGGAAAALLLDGPRGPSRLAARGHGRAMETMLTIGFAVVLVGISVVVAGELVRLLGS